MLITFFVLVTVQVEIYGAQGAFGIVLALILLFASFEVFLGFGPLFTGKVGKGSHCISLGVQLW